MKRFNLAKAMGYDALTLPHFVLNLLFSIGFSVIFVGSVGDLRAQHSQDSIGTPPSTLPTSDPICSIPEIHHRAVVLFESSASAVLGSTSPESKEQEVQLKSAKGTLTLKANNGMLAIDDLALDETYTVLLLNNCGNWEEVSSIETFYKEDGEVVVGDAMYETIGQWTDLAQKPYIYHFLASRTDVSRLEKLAFMQQFYFQGQPFSDDVKDGENLPTPAPKGGDPLTGTTGTGLDCNCGWMAKYTNAFTPGRRSNVQNYGVIIPLVDDNRQVGAREGYRAWRDRRESGPAHRLQTWSEGDCTNGDGDDWNSLPLPGNPNFAPRQATLNFALICERDPDNDTQIPEECQCTKNLNINYRYEVNQNTHAATHSPWWQAGCGNRGAHALAEEYAIMTSTDRNGNIQVLDMGASRVSSTCSNGINAQALVTNYFNYVVNAIPVILAAAGATNGGAATMPTQDQLTALANSASTLFSTPYLQATGTCGQHTRSATLLRNKRQIPLMVNRPLAITMSAFTKVQAGGFTSWRSNARASSNFALLGHVSLPDPKVTYQYDCCLKSVAQYIVGGEAPGSPNNHDAMQRHVGSELPLYASYWNGAVYSPSSGQMKIEGNFARLEGPMTPHCKKGGQKNMVINPKGNPVIVRENGVYLDPIVWSEEQSLPIRATVTDLLGREILLNSSPSIGTPIWDFSKTSSTEIGLYILTIEGPNGKVSFPKIG